MHIPNKIRGTIRIILSLLLIYSSINVFYTDIVIRFNDPTEVLVGHVCGLAIVLYFSTSLFLNGVIEFRQEKLKYKTYFPTMVATIVFVYFLIQEILDRKDITVALFVSLLILLFGYLTVYDFLYFKKVNKSIQAEAQI